MKELIVTGLDFCCPRDALAKHLHTGPGEELYEQVMDILDVVERDTHPGFLMKDLALGPVDKTGFDVGGFRFSSKIAAHKLAGAGRVTLYIATCGPQIGRMLEETQDELDRYIVDQIAYLAYLEANRAMLKAIHEKWGMDKFIRLCPGSIIDWSVGDVCHFFGLLEGQGLYEQLGVRVLDSGLIHPLKSSSGLLLETEEAFESCSICPRENCENRREPFDLALHEQMVCL